MTDVEKSLSAHMRDWAKENRDRLREVKEMSRSEGRESNLPHRSIRDEADSYYQAPVVKPEHCESCAGGEVGCRDFNCSCHD